MTKEESLKEFLADKIFSTGEEGFNAGWEAARKHYQEQVVDMSAPASYGSLQVEKPQARVTLENMLARHSNAQQSQAALQGANLTAQENQMLIQQRMSELDDLIRSGRINSHEQAQKFLKKVGSLF